MSFLYHIGKKVKALYKPLLLLMIIRTDINNNFDENTGNNNNCYGPLMTPAIDAAVVVITKPLNKPFAT